MRTLKTKLGALLLALTLAAGLTTVSTAPATAATSTGSFSINQPLSFYGSPFGWVTTSSGSQYQLNGTCVENWDPYNNVWFIADGGCDNDAWDWDHARYCPFHDPYTNTWQGWFHTKVYYTEFGPGWSWAKVAYSSASVVTC